MAGFAVVDCETTGLGAPSDRIVEIAVVLLDDAGRPEGSWSSLVNPDRPVGATSIHGIGVEDIARAPGFADISDTVAGLLESRVFVAHNVGFDASFVEAEFASGRQSVCHSRRGEGLHDGTVENLSSRRSPFACGRGFASRNRSIGHPSGPCRRADSRKSPPDLPCPRGGRNPLCRCGADPFRRNGPRRIVAGLPRARRFGPYSRKSRRTCEREGWRSLDIVFDSIWRIRSRVTE